MLALLFLVMLAKNAHAPCLIIFSAFMTKINLGMSPEHSPLYVKLSLDGGLWPSLQSPLPSSAIS